MTRADVCVTTSCDLDRAECEADIEKCNDTCLNGSLDALQACYGVCRGIECPACSADDDTCLEYGYEFSVTGQPDKSVEVACEVALARDIGCGEENIDPRCTHFAKLERPESVEAYRCIAESPCGTALDRCTRGLPGTLGTEICADRGDGCTEIQCDSAAAIALNQPTAWLADDVQAMARACLREPCGRRTLCLSAWFDAVFV
jgi:hypothetical protein